ncbi:hypothetical protein Back11_48860 [Paenibacillus baekrokdamisoli]|uniref:Rhamnogalacturonase A/B/Epimerase-like pectate lyase domain-containing protein n=1 Tax=Paenibacillus baekrokdamisoli TaxID=1712516 RepID=A0A3G9JC81_9BACL|nr:glycosyl hydrolase family 28-related protein [Paenibacillus baekrokdamisoli]MBB3068711.1 hypothetical protein [Paenibacillus baekrokdamisoli]BBH23541.1 hypothetical protein Back11_48860 [Paenibacillus baekrokdamisoli]
MPNITVVNVRDYGAVGDGITNDTEALRLAFEAAPYQTVVLPKGTYLTGTITIPAHVEVNFQNGATLVLEEGAVLELNGKLSAGPYPIFDFPYERNSGTAKVVFQGFQSLTHWLPEWFGAVGDAKIDERVTDLPIVSGTDSSLAFEKCFLVMSQTGVATVKLNHGNYLFAHEVNVFDGNFCLEGSTHAKFSSVPTSHNPSDYSIHMDTGYITGKGIEALFHIKQSEPLHGYFGFLIERAFFRSYHDGPQSVVKVTGPAFPVLGAPPRPCVFDNCRVFKFRKAIWSSATFGLGTLNVTNCYFSASDFTGNHYAVYSDAYGGVTNFNFINNVSEQGGKILFERVHEPGYGYFGSLEGQFRIEGNLLEGQTDPIVIHSNVASGSIRNNYFEANSGSIIEFHCLGRDPDLDGLKEDVSTIEICDNFYHVLKNPVIVLDNCRVTKLDISNEPGIRVNLSGVRRYSRDSENTKVGIHPSLGDFCGFSVDFSYLRDNLYSAVPLADQGVIPFTQGGMSSIRMTPLGSRSSMAFEAETEWKPIPIPVHEDEIFVVGSILKKTTIEAEFVGLSVSDNEGNVKLSTPQLVQLINGPRSFTAVFFAIDGALISGEGNLLRYSCSRSGNEITDAYCYTVKKNEAQEQFSVFLQDGTTV